MAIYTVHEPPLKRYETTPDPERIRFVRDGFSFWAFLVAPIWMLRHRLWLVFVGYVVLVGAIGVALHLAGASATARTVIALVVSILIGLEAGTLRRFALGRRGFQNVGLVAGDTLEAAERRFFDGWVRRGDVASPTPAPPPVMPAARVATTGPEVIGLFPEPGAQR